MARDALVSWGHGMCLGQRSGSQTGLDYTNDNCRDGLRSPNEIMLHSPS